MRALASLLSNAHIPGLKFGKGASMNKRPKYGPQHVMMLMTSPWKESWLSGRPPLPLPRDLHEGQLLGLCCMAGQWIHRPKRLRTQVHVCPGTMPVETHLRCATSRSSTQSSGCSLSALALPMSRAECKGKLFSGLV